MASLSDHKSSTITKLLLLGNSSSGKTGALASLAAAGYKLWILDFDNGLDILVTKIRELGAQHLANVEYETCTDKFTVQGGKPVPLTADAWQKGVNTLEKWSKAGLGPNDIVVLDTLTFAGKAALRYIQKLAAHVGQQPTQPEWGAGQTLVENLVAMLTSDAMACNVIVSAHIKYIGNEESGEAVMGFPDVLGKALSPTLGRYFNAVLLAKSIGSGAATKRTIHTNTFANIELKNPNPAKVPAQLPIATGLADYFKAVRAG